MKEPQKIKYYVEGPDRFRLLSDYMLVRAHNQIKENPEAQPETRTKSIAFIRSLAGSKGVVRESQLNLLIQTYQSMFKNQTICQVKPRRTA